MAKIKTDLKKHAIDIEDAFMTPPPPMDFVLPGFLKGTVGLLTSPGAVGKTWLALELCCAVVSSRANQQLLKLPMIEHGKAVLLSAEDTTLALLHRMHALGKFLSPEAREEIQQGFQLVPLVGMQTDLCPEADAKGTLAVEDWSDTIAEQCKGARLIVLDTLSRWHTKEENSNSDMASLLKRAEWLASVTGASILFLHHTSKAMAVNERGDEQQSARGASTLVDNARWQAAICGMTETEAKAVSPAMKVENRKYFRRFVVSKQNHGLPMDDVWLQRKDDGVLVRFEIGQNVLDRIGAAKGQNKATQRRTREKM